jgi:hypothetical protein
MISMKAKGGTSIHLSFSVRWYGNHWTSYSLCKGRFSEQRDVLRPKFRMGDTWCHVCEGVFNGWVKS